MYAENMGNSVVSYSRGTNKSEISIHRPLFVGVEHAPGDSDHRGVAEADNQGRVVEFPLYGGA